MRIMTISDEESKYLWDYYDKKKLEGIDLIISCGDLKAEYLSFLATMTKAPVLYVAGNHDVKYQNNPPGGCICIDDKIYVHEGIRILGLGGSMRYHPGPFQYTEKEMRKRVKKIKFALWRNKGFDILVAHAPAFQINDGTDVAHKGFQVFVELIDRYKPRFFLHGHVHLNYGREHKRTDKYNDTFVINSFERYVFDYESDELSSNKHGIANEK